MQRSSWAGWLAHFERTAARPLPEVGRVEVDSEVRVRVARSLAVFQRGEAGEGRIAKEIDRVELQGIDDTYRRALRLFIAEEGRHARILAGAVRALDGEILAATWTDRLFVWGRRLAGVRLKLLVLLAAEVIGITFYGLIAGALGGEIGRALEEIARDERDHLDFHVDFFRTEATSVLRGWLFRVAWAAVGTAACLTVLLDHRATLRALGIPVRTAYVNFTELLSSVRDRVLPAARRAPAVR